MKRILDLTYWHLFVFIFMLLVIWSANLLWNSVPIAPVQIITAACLYTLYSYVIFRLILFYWYGTVVQKVLGIGIYLFITLTVFFFMRKLIYVLLPLMGIHFSRRAQPLQLHLFNFHMGVRYFVTNLIGGFTFWRQHAYRTEKENIVLNSELATFRERAQDMKYTSHFLQSVFVTSFGKMMLSEVPQDRHTKRDIMQFLAYLLRIENLGKAQPFAAELDELHCFIRLLRYHYKERSIRYRERMEDCHYPDIPAGMLFFPLENCLKHAKIDAKNPVEMQLTAVESGISLRCQNHWSPKKSDINSETGFALLDAKLKQVDYKSTVKKLLRDDIFTVHINLDFTNRK